jgi:hypothetical protein
MTAPIRKNTGFRFLLISPAAGAIRIRPAFAFAGFAGFALALALALCNLFKISAWRWWIQW